MSGDRLLNLVTFCSYLYPLLTYLVLIPLFYLARFYLGDLHSLLVCLLYLFIPNVTLMNLHLDQVIYPTLFVLSLFLFMAAIRSRSPALGILCGVATYLGLYVTFSLVSLFPLMGMFCVARAVSLRSDKREMSFLLRVIGGLAFGFLIPFALFRLVLDYDMILRYRRAMYFHEHWKIVYHSFQTIIYSSFVNYVEFGVWIGLPLAVVYVDDALDSVARFVRRKPDWIDCFSAFLLVIFILLGGWGRTISEVGRLWLYLTPIVCLVSVRSLTVKYPQNLKAMILMMIFIEWTTTLLIKHYQDF